MTFSGEAVTGASFDPAAVGDSTPANRIRQQTRTIPLTATVTDQHNQTASAVANVTITLNPVATRRDIVFPNRSTRVNNAAKRYLIEELTPQLRNDPNSTVILVCHRDTTETGPAAANLDTERALNAAAVLSAGTGVCPSLDLSPDSGELAGPTRPPPLPFGDASVLERPGQAVSATDQSAPFRRVEVWFIPREADQPAVSGLQRRPFRRSRQGAVRVSLKEDEYPTPCHSLRSRPPRDERMASRGTGLIGSLWRPGGRCGNCSSHTRREGFRPGRDRNRLPLQIDQRRRFVEQRSVPRSPRLLHALEIDPRSSAVWFAGMEEAGPTPRAYTKPRIPDAPGPCCPPQRELPSGPFRFRLRTPASSRRARAPESI